MSLKLMYITNNTEIAKIAEKSGVDRIFVDLETVGKQERQGGVNTVQSHHISVCGLRERAVNILRIDDKE